MLRFRKGQAREPVDDWSMFLDNREIFKRFARVCGMIVQRMLWGRIKEIGVKLEPRRLGTFRIVVGIPTTKISYVQNSCV